MTRPTSNYVDESIKAHASELLVWAGLAALTALAAVAIGGVPWWAPLIATAPCYFHLAYLHRYSNWRPPMYMPGTPFSRWLQFVADGETLLHRVAAASWIQGEEGIAGHCTMVCGKSGDAVMPGIFSRMWADRCRSCCRGTGVPTGQGVPHNHGILEPDDG